MFQHPSYDSGPGFTQNDISVVQATSTISGPNIAAGQMASTSNNPGGNGWITGWGRTCGKITSYCVQYKDLNIFFTFVSLMLYAFLLGNILNGLKTKKYINLNALCLDVEDFVLKNIK